jgi:ABC-type dipeptide/oligopeptide/nickel transport system permease component
LIGISLVVFLLTSLIPGDVVTVMLGMMRSPQASPAAALWAGSAPAYALSDLDGGRDSR